MSAGDPEVLKGLGNDALKNRKYEDAINYYSQAITVAKTQNKPTHVYYSNRCAANLNKQDYDAAYDDAEACINAKPDWAKGYLRKGSALSFLNRHAEAEATYLMGLDIEPNNKPLTDALSECRSKLTGPGNSQPLKTPFGSPAEMLRKLQSDDRTKNLFKDPTYLAMIQDIQRNPQQNMMKYIQDPRMMTTMSVLIGLPTETAPGQDGDKHQTNQNDEMDTSESNKTSDKKPEKVEEMTDDPVETDENVKKAEEEKALGTAAYKNKEFGKAHEHYKKAFEYDSTNLVYLMNTAAVYLEQKEFSLCRETCLKAVDVGREHNADYKLIAKALNRAGTSYERENKLDQAILWYGKSIAEYRDQNVVKKIKKLEKQGKEEKRRAYFNDDKFLENKNLGNEAFKKGQFPEAVKFYNDCLLRKDDTVEANAKPLAIIYSNRAACYTKLMEFNLAVSDCDKANKLDSTYLKAYLRKGTALEGLKKTSDAKSVFQKAMEIDPSSAEAQNGFQRCLQKSYIGNNNSNESEKDVQQRVLNDPEVMNIMQDPAIRLILEQCASDPQALQTHLQNPHIAGKLQKLVDIGVIQIRGK